MIHTAELEHAYDAAFAALAPGGAGLRPETEDDEAFLRELCSATHPLRDVLPAPMLAQQVDLRVAAFRGGFPGAMRRILMNAARPAGRIIVDWDHPTGSRCIDLAVHPADSGRGLGTALLRAWIGAAERRGLACTLNVAPLNRARALYVRLGFEDSSNAEFGSLGTEMVRAATS